MTYELIDTESANLVGIYGSEAAVLEVVRAAIQAHGAAAIDPLALGYEDDQGNGGLIAEGADLVALAHKRDPGKFARPA